VSHYLISSRRFSLITLSLLFSAVSLIFIGNCLVDPLWHFGGNLIDGKNPRYNERVQKVNLYLQNPSDYDCFIFGSSRTTLLNQNAVEGYNCFNFAFSSGRIEEFSAYADWLVARGASPKLVIVGVDDFSLLHAQSTLNVPDFILTNKSPIGVVDSYLSLPMLRISMGVLTKGIRKPRYYANGFVGAVKDGIPSYEPVLPSLLPEYTGDAEEYSRCTGVGRYKDLINKFEGARVIGYVPPVSFWHLGEKSSTSYSHYLNSVFQVSYCFTDFFDFSVPSPMTADRVNTYDGSHFSTQVNDKIAGCFSGGQCGFYHLRPHLMLLDDYVKEHQLSMQAIYNSLK